MEEDEFMSKEPTNCWDFHRCGRQPGGAKEKEIGVCPVTTAKAFDGMHAGKNGGRVCWAISSTLCKGERQGNFANKAKDCLQCDFYNLVHREEGTRHLLPIGDILRGMQQ